MAARDCAFQNRIEVVSTSRCARHVLRVQDHAGDRQAAQHSVLSSSAQNDLDRERSQHATAWTAQPYADRVGRIENRADAQAASRIRRSRRATAWWLIGRPCCAKCPAMRREL